MTERMSCRGFFLGIEKNRGTGVRGVFWRCRRPTSAIMALHSGRRMMPIDPTMPQPVA